MMALQGQPMQLFGQQTMQLVMQSHQGPQGMAVSFHPMQVMHSMPMALLPDQESPTKKTVKRKRVVRGEGADLLTPYLHAFMLQAACRVRHPPLPP